MQYDLLFLVYQLSEIDDNLEIKPLDSIIAIDITFMWLTGDYCVLVFYFIAVSLPIIIRNQI